MVTGELGGLEFSPGRLGRVVGVDAGFGLLHTAECVYVEFQEIASLYCVLSVRCSVQGYVENHVEAVVECSAGPPCAMWILLCSEWTDESANALPQGVGNQ